MQILTVMQILSVLYEHSIDFRPDPPLPARFSYAKLIWSVDMTHNVAYTKFNAGAFAKWLLLAKFQVGNYRYRHVCISSTGEFLIFLPW